jgi:hypothetical protein
MTKGFQPQLKEPLRLFNLNASSGLFATLHTPVIAAKEYLYTFYCTFAPNRIIKVRKIQLLIS